MNPRTTFPWKLIVLLLPVALLLVQCNNKPASEYVSTDPIGCLRITPGDPLQIGVIQALSGAIAPLGQEQLRGIELAMDHWGGEILGHPIVLQIEDSQCSSEGGANAALRILADPQTAGVIGTTCSGAAATASRAMSEAGLTMISGNNSAPFLTSRNGQPASLWQPGYFRTANNEEHAGKAAALYSFRELGIRRAATINDGDIYTQGLTDGFGQMFEELGGTIVLAAAIEKGSQQVKPVLDAVLNADAQMVFFPLFQPDGNHILTQARSMPGLDGLILMSDGALLEKSFLEDVEEKAKGLYFVGPHQPKNQAQKGLREKYEAKYNTAPSASYYFNAYDAANLLFQALTQAATKDDQGNLHIGRQALRDLLYATEDFEGITGTLTCNEFGDCASPVFNVLRLDDPVAGLEGLLSNVLFTYTPNTAKHND